MPLTLGANKRSNSSKRSSDNSFHQLPIPLALCPGNLKHTPYWECHHGFVITLSSVQWNISSVFNQSLAVRTHTMGQLQHKGTEQHEGYSFFIWVPKAYPLFWRLGQPGLIQKNPEIKN